MLSSPQFPQMQSEDRTLNQMQKYIIQAFSSQTTGLNTELNSLSTSLNSVQSTLSLNPFISGQLLSSVALTSGANSVAHTLAKTPVGYLVLSRNANTEVWLTSSNSQTLTLNVSANVTATLWVF